MTARITAGATDWSDGEILYAADLNDTMDAGRVHRALITDATEYTETGTSFVTKKTFTLTPSTSNNILLGWRVRFQVKTGGTGFTDAKLVQGLQDSPEYRTGDSAYHQTAYFYGRPGTDWSGGSTNSWGGTGSLTNGISMNQSTYAFNIQLKHSVGGGGSDTAFIQNIEVEVYWLEYPTDGSSQIA